MMKDDEKARKQKKMEQSVDNEESFVLPVGVNDSEFNKKLNSFTMQKFGRPVSAATTG